MKVNKVLDMILGMISGICILKKVVIGLVFMEVVVCMRFWLKLISVVVIVMIIKGVLSVVCVRIIF